MVHKNPEERREYSRKWRAKRRSDWLTKNGPCVQCGSNEKLEVDHIDPKQKISHNIWSWSDERRLKELEKCQVLCHVCHMAKTLLQRTSAMHGSSMMYQNGCRCDACKTYNTERRRRQYKGDWSNGSTSGLHPESGGSIPSLPTKSNK